MGLEDVALTFPCLLFMQTENLCYYKNVDGTLTPGYSLGQGE